MKKWLRFWVFVNVLCVPVIVFAEDVVTTQDWKQTLIASILTALVAGLVTLAGWIGKLLGKFISKKIEDIDNDILQKAAYIAVRYVEDKFVTMTGNDKFKEACKAVADKIPGITQTDIEEAVRAMYVNFSNEIPK